MNGRRSLAILARLALVLLLGLGTAGATERIIAVGDVHGNLEGLREILRQSELVDESGAWVGQSAVLVQTGDLLDRGPEFRGVLDYLCRLEAEATAAGGRVIVLLGNHEVMNLLGDLRYVTEDNFAQFAGPESEKRLAAAWKQYVKYRKKQARRLGLEPPAMGPEAEAAWRVAHPEGFVEQREALGPLGEYGRWLRARPATVKVDGTVFVHGGISPALASRSPEQIRDRVTEEISLWDRYLADLVAQGVALPFFTLDEVFDAVRLELKALEGKETPTALDRIRFLEAVVDSGNWYLQHPDGPLWFRGYEEWAEEEGAAELGEILEAQGARRLVVGHTPTEDRRISLRFGGTVAMIDTGMLDSYYKGGRASALEITSAGLVAIYTDGRVPLGRADDDAGGEESAELAVDWRWRDPEGRPLPFQSDESLLELLRTAMVVQSERIKSGVNQPWKLLLELDGIRLHAVFGDVDISEDEVVVHGKRELFFGDSYYFEPAAYELARMLDLHTIPPATLRQVGKDEGSIQIWVENAMTEMKRREESIQPPDVEDWNHQMQTVRLFDSLVLNTDRNAGNLLIDEGWNLWMIDHTRAFRRSKKIPDAPGFAQCDGDPAATWTPQV